MLLTVSLLSKGSLLGSLINKCRQVVRIKNVKPIETNLKPNISTSPNVDMPPQSSVIVNTLSHTNRPVSVANISLSSSSAVTSRTLEEHAGMPPKPKKPMTPFFRFMKELRPKMQASNPNLPLTAIVSEISKQWRNADDSLKQRLQEEFKKDQQQYIEKRTKYDAKITDEQRSHLKELKQEQTDAKERRMMRKRIRDLGRPKKPASAFLIFISKERLVTPQTAKQTYREWHRQTTTKWSTLTDEEKSVYLQESRKEMERYK